MAGAATELKLSPGASRFLQTFDAYTLGASARWEKIATARLLGEGAEAARAYERPGGGEAAALAAVSPEVWRKYITRLWLTTVPAAGELVSAQLIKAAAADLFIQAASKWLRQNAAERVGQLTDTGRAEIGNQIRIGFDKNETQKQIAERIRNHRRSITPARAKQIAWTEVHNAANFGSLVAAGDVRVPVEKIWARGTRPTHAAATGQRRALHEPFDVGGGRLMHPGDTSLGAGPELVVNCRCGMIYEVQEARRPRRRPAA